MDDLVARIWEDLLGRLSGPLRFRILIQPAVALLFGVRDGLNDARRGAPAYFWAIFTAPSQCLPLVREGWQAVTKVFVIALVLDVVYQLLVLGFVYPGEAMLVAFLLAMLPYLLIRGPANRVARVVLLRRSRAHR